MNENNVMYVDYNVPEQILRSDMFSCESNGHYQQAFYSIQRDIFTVICFDCKKVSTTVRRYKLERKRSCSVFRTIR